MQARLCVHCQQSYTPRSSNQKYCDGCVQPRQVPAIRMEPVLGRGQVTRVTPERTAALLKLQGGVCAICQQRETMVDEHGEPMTLTLYWSRGNTTAKGLLCRACQTGLLWFRDAPALLAAGISFLTQGDRKTRTMTARIHADEIYDVESQEMV